VKIHGIGQSNRGCLEKWVGVSKKIHHKSHKKREKRQKGVLLSYFVLFVPFVFFVVNLLRPSGLNQKVRPMLKRMTVRLSLDNTLGSVMSELAFGL
jgi:hypothetical protein